MAEQRSMNFFTEELCRYYSERGIALNGEVIGILDKIPLQLSADERRVLAAFVLPRRQQIKQALRERFVHGGAGGEAWRGNLPLYAATVVGQIAAEMMIEQEVLEPGRKAPAPVPTCHDQDRPSSPPSSGQAVGPIENDHPSSPFLTLMEGRGAPFSAMVRARKGRRRIFKRRRGADRRMMLGSFAIALLALALFVFSPWGPGRRVLFRDNAGQVLTALRNEKLSSPVPPTIAIVVDDVGESAENLERWIEIDAPLTFSVKPHCRYSEELASELYLAGYRIMMHVPVENQYPHAYAGEGQIATDMDRETVFGVLDGDLATVPHAVGINNHDGEKGCCDLRLMTWQCEWAVERSLFVMDNAAYGQGVLSRTAITMGLERRCNQVFIDERNDAGFVRSAMERLGEVARQYGVAIGVCAFGRSCTPGIVREMIDKLRADGSHFAFVQDVHN